MRGSRHIALLVALCLLSAGATRAAAIDVEQTRRRAAAGDARAQNDLGLAYHHGDGVERDAFEAFRWYSAAAAHGLATAEYNLGLLYDEGVGMPRDPAQAARWYRQAAFAGNVAAGYELGGSDCGDLLECA